MIKKLFSVFVAFIINATMTGQVSISIETENLNTVPTEGIIDLRNTNSSGNIFPFVIDGASSSNDVNSVTGSLSVGSLYYDETDNVLKVYNGTEWISI